MNEVWEHKKEPTMTLLKNGSTLLLEELTTDGESMVLAQTVTGAFVTWRKDDEGDTFWGNYFPQTLTGLKEAIQSFEDRIGH